MGAVARVIGLGAVIDLIYQIMVFRGVHPLQLVVIVLLLAFVPYLLLRGPVNRIARRFMRARCSSMGMADASARLSRQQASSSAERAMPSWR